MHINSSEAYLTQFLLIYFDDKDYAHAIIYSCQLNLQQKYEASQKTFQRRYMEMYFLKISLYPNHNYWLPFSQYLIIVLYLSISRSGTKQRWQ